MIPLIYIALGLLTVVFAFIIKWKHMTGIYSEFYCPSNLPFFGSSLWLDRDPVKMFDQLKEIGKNKKGDALLWFGWKPVLFISSPKYLEVLLSSKDLIKKSSLYNFLLPWLGTGLLTSYGSKWKSRRRILTPSFHFSMLSKFTDIFQSHAEDLVKRLSKYEGKPIDVQPLVGVASLESICETSMGLKIDAEDPKNSGYVTAIGNLSDEIQYRQRSPWLWLGFLYLLTKRGRRYWTNLKYIHNYTLDVINKRIALKTEEAASGKSVEISESKKLSFLDNLLQLYFNNEIDIDGIREEVDTFVFEGHDTTSSGISFCLYLLGKYPEHQKTLQDEIDKAEGDDISDKVKNMTFLDYVVKETLRLYPPVPLFARYAERDTELGGSMIYKGTEITVDVTNLHRNEQHWENPLVFNPYRFGEESFTKRHAYSYIPFSAGPRNCIGQRYALLETKIYIYNVLKNFTLHSVHGEEDLETSIDIVTKSRNGLQVEFRKR